MRIGAAPALACLWSSLVWFDRSTCRPSAAERLQIRSCG